MMKSDIRISPLVFLLIVSLASFFVMLAVLDFIATENIKYAEKENEHYPSHLSKEMISTLVPNDLFRMVNKSLTCVVLKREGMLIWYIQSDWPNPRFEELKDFYDNSDLWELSFHCKSISDLVPFVTEIVGPVEKPRKYAFLMKKEFGISL